MAEPILCRDPDDDTKPCPFAGQCHQARQRLSHRLGMRGEDCWAFSLLRAELAYQPTQAPVQVVPTEARP